MSLPRRMWPVLTEPMRRGSKGASARIASRATTRMAKRRRVRRLPSASVGEDEEGVADLAVGREIRGAVAHALARGPAEEALGGEALGGEVLLHALLVHEARGLGGDGGRGCRRSARRSWPSPAGEGQGRASARRRRAMAPPTSAPARGGAVEALLHDLLGDAEPARDLALRDALEEVGLDDLALLVGQRGGDRLPDGVAEGAARRPRPRAPRGRATCRGGRGRRRASNRRSPAGLLIVHTGGGSPPSLESSPAPTPARARARRRAGDGGVGRAAADVPAAERWRSAKRRGAAQPALGGRRVAQQIEVVAHEPDDARGDEAFEQIGPGLVVVRRS